MEDQKSATSLGMEANVAAGLSYFFGWVTGILFFVLEKKNPFTRFHAAQSTVTFGGITILQIGLAVLSLLPGIGVLFGLLSALLGVGSILLWIFCLVQAFQGRQFRLPLMGEFAEKLFETNWDQSATVDAPPSKIRS